MDREAVGKYIVVDNIVEDIKSGGINYGTTASQKNLIVTGKVVHVGDELDKINVGDIVRYKTPRSFEIYLDGKLHIGCDIGDIVTVDRPSESE